MGEPGPSTDQEEALERQGAQKIIRAFRSYELEGKLDVLRWEANLKKVSPRHQRILSSLQDKFLEARECLSANQAFLNQLVSVADQEDGCPDEFRTANQGGGASDASSSPSESRVSAMDVEKVRYVLKDLVREWSAEGAIERSQSFDKLIKALRECFPRIDPRSRPRVLVPGCGLGRLVLEIASKGFMAEGNEFSYYMMFTSAFVINYATSRNQWVIHPYCLNPCNNRTNKDQLRAVAIPDVCANDFADSIQDPDQLSICGGDFVEVYSREEHKCRWDSVVTCFFVDTAHNFVDYLETIHHCLKPGGVWLNLGPLLWHWADSHTYLGDELSLEVAWEDVQRVAESMGFRTDAQEMAKCNYTGNLRSMMQTVYYCNFSRMTKV